MAREKIVGYAWSFRLLLILFIPLTFITSLCIASKVFCQALHPVNSLQVPLFLDDSDRQSLLQAAHRQAAYLQKQATGRQVTLAGKNYSRSELLSSLRYFISLVEQTANSRELARILQKEFSIYQAAGKNTGKVFGEMLVTGYYEPLFAGSLQRQEPFLHPLYSPPADLVSRKSRHDQKAHLGRWQEGSFLPYWTRAEIETNNILAGNELIYLKDPFEAFLLHVQGSGKILLKDGSTKSVCYAISNGHPYRSIGKLLIDEKKIARDEATLPIIEQYLREHPAELPRILRYNPRFIFFNWGDSNGPRGSNNVLLTAGRSIAIDQQVLPPGTIAFLVSQRPVFTEDGSHKGWAPIQRFVFPQDSGAAIEGAGRVDLFLGDGHEARLMAGLMKEPGSLYFLLKK